jgi:prepilin-type N-terminal cleavage/methylation domain-containing protein
MRRDGFTLIELMIVIAIIAVIAAIAIPGILAATRAANERNASGSLRQMSATQVRFKSSDADSNFINDYYTADVAGLYYLTPTGGGQIRFIELAVALADGNTVPTDWTFAAHQSSPKAGYWFQTLPGYEDPPGAMVAYGTRHPDRFGYIAYPNAYGSSGRLCFILNEGGTIYKKDPGAQATYVSTTPLSAVADTAGVLTSGPPNYQAFPMDPMQSSAFAAGPWSKMD